MERVQYYWFALPGAASQNLTSAQIHHAVLDVASIGGVNQLVLPSAVAVNEAMRSGPRQSMFVVNNSGAGTVRLVAGAGATIGGSADIITGESVVLTIHCFGAGAYTVLVNHGAGVAGPVPPLDQVLAAGNTTGGTNIDVNGSDDITLSGAATQRITKSTAGAGQDMHVELTGATDSSLFLTSTGTAADAIRLQASAATGGMDVDVGSGGADINAVDGRVTLSSNMNSTSAVLVTTLPRAAGDPTGGIRLATAVPLDNVPGRDAGDITIAPGAGGPGTGSTGGVGGALSVTTGVGGAGDTGGAGGNLSVVTGAGAVGAGPGGDGGDITLSTGAGGLAAIPIIDSGGDGGDFTLSGGAGGAGPGGGLGGGFTLTCGTGGSGANSACGAGGAIAMTTGTGGYTSTNGSLTNGGDGGNYTVAAGSGATGPTANDGEGGDGGVVTITTGPGGPAVATLRGVGGAGGGFTATASVGGAATSTDDAVAGPGGAWSASAGAGGAAVGNTGTGGNGGDLTGTAGAGGNASGGTNEIGGTGGDVTFTCGVGGSTSGSTGTGGLSGVGGALGLLAGAGGAAATAGATGGDGGTWTGTAGAGGAAHFLTDGGVGGTGLTGGVGGVAQITGGVGGAINGNAKAGLPTIVAGLGGEVFLRSGAGGAITNSTHTLDRGGNGGRVHVTAGAGGASAGGAGGNGGDITLICSNGGTGGTTGGRGGSINLTCGVGGGPDGDGGNIRLTPTQSSGAATQNGWVNIETVLLASPTVISAVALQGGVVWHTPANSITPFRVGGPTYAVTNLDLYHRCIVIDSRVTTGLNFGGIFATAGVGSLEDTWNTVVPARSIGSMFVLHVIDVGTGGAGIVITTMPGAGITSLYLPTVPPITVAPALGSRTFTFFRTGANAYSFA